MFPFFSSFFRYFCFFSVENGDNTLLALISWIRWLCPMDIVRWPFGFNVIIQIIWSIANFWKRRYETKWERKFERGSWNNDTWKFDNTKRNDDYIMCDAVKVYIMATHLKMLHLIRFIICMHIRETIVDYWETQRGKIVIYLLVFVLLAPC